MLLFQRNQRLISKYLVALGASSNVHEKDKDTDRGPYALGCVVHTIKVKAIVV